MARKLIRLVATMIVRIFAGWPQLLLLLLVFSNTAHILFSPITNTLFSHLYPLCGKYLQHTHKPTHTHTNTYTNIHTKTIFNGHSQDTLGPSQIFIYFISLTIGGESCDSKQQVSAMPHTHTHPHTLTPLHLHV